MKTRKRLLMAALLCIALTVCFVLASCGSEGASTVDQLRNELGVTVDGKFEEDTILDFRLVSDDERELIVERIAEQMYNKVSEIFVYDISLLKDGQQVQPDGKVKVSIPVEVIGTLKDYIVMHLKDDSTVNTIIPTVADGKLTFETDSFSYFVIAELLHEEEVRLVDLEVDFSGSEGIIKNYPDTPETITVIAERFSDVVMEGVTVYGVYSDGKREVLSKDEYTVEGNSFTGIGFYTRSFHCIGEYGEEVRKEVEFRSVFLPTYSISIKINGTDIVISDANSENIELDIANASIDFNDYTVTAVVDNTEVELLISYTVDLGKYDKDNVKVGGYAIHFSREGTKDEVFDFKHIFVSITCAHSDTSDWKSDENGHFKTCNACAETISADKHNYGKGVAGKDESGADALIYTCTICNYKDYQPPCTHDWSDWMAEADNYVQHYKICYDCDEKEWGDHVFSGEYESLNEGHIQWCEICLKGHSEPQAHSGGTATCTEQAVCEVCNKPYGEYDADSHSYGEWEADLTNSIYHSRSCECGESESEKHEFDEGVLGMYPDGSSEAIVYTCSVCEYKNYTEPDHVHTYGEWQPLYGTASSDQHYRECKCGNIEYEKHVVSDEWSEGTGNGHIKVCTVCGADAEYGYHEYGDEGEEGVDLSGAPAMIYTCTVCGYKKYDHLHVYGDWQPDYGTASSAQHYRECECGNAEYEDHVLPDEWSEGTDNGHIKVCTVCGADAEYGYHEYGDEGEEGVDPSGAPAMIYTCTVCGYKRYEERHVHEWTEWIFDGENYEQHYSECECGEISWADHEFGEWTAEQDAHFKTCEVCLKCTVLEEHNYNTEEITDENGNTVIISTCTECQHQVSETTSHTHEFDEGVEEVDEYGNAVYVYTCVSCGEKEYEYYDDALYGIDGRRFGDCDYFMVLEVIVLPESSRTVYILRDCKDRGFGDGITLPIEGENTVYEMTWDLNGFAISNRCGAPNLAAGTTWRIIAPNGGAMLTGGSGFASYDGSEIEGVVEITGGLYDFDPSDYVPDGYTVTITREPLFIIYNEESGEEEFVAYSELLALYGSYSAIIASGEYIIMEENVGLWVVHGESVTQDTCNHDTGRYAEVIYGEFRGEYCTLCGAALEHEHQIAWAGYLEGHEGECIVCRNIVETGEHTFGEYTETVSEYGEPMQIRYCTVCDYSDYIIEHSGGTATCNELAVCEICGSSYGEYADHVSGRGYAYDEEGHFYACINCRAKFDRADHEFGDWTEDVAPTDTTNGIRTRECFVCGCVQSEVFWTGDHEHSYSTDWSTDDNGHWYAATCACCESGAVLEYGEHDLEVVETYVKLGDHDGDGVQDSPNILVTSSKCSVCSYILITEEEQ